MRLGIHIGRGLIIHVDHVDVSSARSPRSSWFKVFTMAVAVGLASFGANAADSLTMADFGHSIKLQVNGYTGSETLQNFPVLVRISESGIPGFLYSGLTNNKGKDIAFFDEAGNHLASEIQTNVWTTSGESLVWVKLPQMSQGTKFYMCYNTSASGAWVTNENPWGDYVGVWHLDETGGPGKVIYDSTTNGLYGVVGGSGNNAGSSAGDGKVGRARKISKQYNKTTDHIHVSLADSAKRAVVDGLVMNNAVPQFTVSLWYRLSTSTPTTPNNNASTTAGIQWEYLIGRRTTDRDTNGGWAIQMDDYNANAGSLVPGQGLRIWSSETKDGYQKGSTRPSISDFYLTANTWIKIDVVYSNTTFRLYHDGEPYANGDLCGLPLNGTGDLGIGGTAATATGQVRPLFGDMDEVRLRCGVRSADWIKADYDTVNNANFVTLAPPEVTWANAEGATPGLTEVGVDTVVFSGSVTDCGGFTNCAIQCKVWPTAESEPENWTTITNGLVASDAFSVIVPGMAALTTYGYKLRAVGDDGETGSAVVSGSFTTQVGFSVAWSDAVAGAEGLSTVGYDSVTISGTVVALGGATACGIEYKIWLSSGSEPGNWTTLTNGLVTDDDFSVAVTGLSPLTTYSYALRASGNDGATTTPVTGTFTTAAGLTVAWANNSGATPGISQVSYDFATVGGTVSALGGASFCIAQGKFWADGESEPSGWTTLTENLVLNEAFSATIPHLTAGTTYHYALRAVGNNDDETVVVSGTFTTQGESGETIGSPETHFFSDGTNSYWVANEFERYLDFTVTGYTGSETLTNFPVLVDVRKDDTNGFSYDDFYHTGGRDIVFVDEKGHIIPHEIDTWNPNGQSLIWVRLPEMNNGTKFTMCYRSPLVNPPSDPGNAFEKYVGVWHMNEKANGIVDVIDSTTNNFVGETHAQSLASSNGRIGGCRRVAQQTGTSSTYGHIIVPDHDDILRTGVGNVFTYSCWSKLADNDPGWAYLVSRKSEDTDCGWGIQYHEISNGNKIRIWSGITNNNKNDCTLLDMANYSYTRTDWACWTFVYDNTNCTAYLDGVKLETKVLKGRSTGNIWPVANDETAAYDGLVIGGQEVGTGALNGWVDECRYSKGVRSDDWIKAEYDSTLQQANWNDPTKRFVTKGTQVGRGEDTLVPVVVWEQGEGMPNTIIDVSYAYVQFAGTVTYCGSGADTCWIEYQIWADGAEVPTEWTTLLADATPGTVFSIPVFGLKQDMPYNFRIRAVNEVDGERRQTREHTGSFRTNGNVNESAADGELMRIDNKFVRMYRAGEYTFTTPDYVTNIEIIVVGGGGAGGYKIGGGGGGGGVFYSESYLVTTGTTYKIIVGRGGHAPTNVETPSSEGNGEYSAFALSTNAANPLIRVPGGGGGGSCNKDVENVVNGSNGASGGGAGGKNDKTTTFATGGAATSVDGVTYGHKGGNGNRQNGSSGSPGTYAAGGGGGGRGAGLAASSDKFYGGGAGGSGVACDMLGEMLYFGAGGGGGYAFYEEKGTGFSKPGAGGSGIGGNAADIKNGTFATSGVENTGAGGGGGSMKKDSSNNPEYWQGGDGGDGVVIISYEVHGRDPISEDPRISMTRCEYSEDAGTAAIDYRMYWAGTQNDHADVYVHYSTIGPEDLTNSAAGGWVKVAESALGVGSVVFTPPEVGYTYWVKVVGRKNASSFYYSEETGSFSVPALRLNGVTWTESKTSPAADYATVSYKLYETNEVTHLYCYWSESREALEGDETPSGDNVYLLDLGANTGTNLSSASSFNLSATEGLVRNRTYYFRLASGDTQGLKRFLSDEIVELDTAEKPVTVLNAASWEDSNVATVGFKAVVGKLDPAEVELVALYGLVESHVKDKRPETNDTVTVISLGLCSDLGLDVTSPSATFPLWSETVTNYYVRLALATNVVVETEGVVTTNRVIVSGSYSSATKTISVSHAIEANTLLYIVEAHPKIMCYGDEPLPLDYVLDYAGQFAWDENNWGWTNKYDLTGAIACYESTNPTPVAVSSTSPSGNYSITQGTLLLEDGGQEKNHIEGGVETKYQYKLTFSGATYTITNAVFATTIADVTTNYTGDACDTSELSKTLSGVRNNQTVTYLYRVGGAGTWGPLPALTDVGNYNVQFKATAPSHDDVRGSFKVTIAPAPLTATIEDVTVNYTGGSITPAAVTSVTGLVRPDLNALTCEFRDESGEWQSEMPSFTSPGTYKVFFRASAPNHTTFVTNCTVTITPWDFMVNMDGTSGYQTPINIGRPEWLIDNSGRTTSRTGMTGEQLSVAEARYAKLDEICDNGLSLWQNYVIERTDFSKKVVATIMQQGSMVDPNAFVVHFPDIEPLMGTGLRVQYRLDKKLRGERTKSEFDAAGFEIGELNGKYETNIPLNQGDPTGLYVFNIVFSPTNTELSGHSVISSVATIGVLRVSSVLTNTVTVSPWLSMSVDSTNEIEIAVADVVNPNSIGAGDSIRAYENSTNETATFREWNRKDDGDWDAPATVTKRGVSQSTAETSTFAPGKAFWLVRTDPGDTNSVNYIYLVGRYTGADYQVELEGGTTNAPGHTLVANPTMFDIDLNDLVFEGGTPAAGDRIITMGLSGLQTLYYPNATNTTHWGRNVTQTIKGRKKQVWVEGGIIPSGTGFWYNRTANTPLRIKFTADR